MNLTLPDGSHRRGKVLEVEGNKAVVQVRFTFVYQNERFFAVWQALEALHEQACFFGCDLPFQLEISLRMIRGKLF